MAEGWSLGGWWLVAGGWWLVVGGWWLVAGGWWLVIGGWQLVAGGCGPQHPTHRHKHIDYSRRRRTQIFCTRDTGYKVFGQFRGYLLIFQNLPGGMILFYLDITKLNNL